jgi:hypothetical protein
MILQNKNLQMKILTENKSILKVIGIYQAVSGAFGIYIALISIATANSTSVYKDLLMAFSALLAASVLISGILLLRQQKLGFYLSIILQVLQVIGFRMGQSFVFTSGVWLVMRVDFQPDLVVTLEFTTLVFHFMLSQTSQSTLFINLFPGLVAYLLLKNRHSFLSVDTSDKAL